MRRIHQADDFLEANIVEGMLGLLPLTSMVSPWVEDDQAAAVHRLIDQYLER